MHPEPLYAKALALYRRYRDGSISEKEFLEKIKPIDQAIDRAEMRKVFMQTLQDTPASERSSSSRQD
jgi:Ca2+-binding EF-hand superfamily protein